jgi:cellulose synthase (UDP-forming)
MSLLGSRKFWPRGCASDPLLLLRFCYCMHTAVFTFAAPAIPVMLIVLPENVRLANYVFIAPSMIYNLVFFPAWHRCRFGPTALMAKLLYGWAHVIAIFDILRRKRMGWQTTGEGKRKVGIRRVWVGISIWNGGTGLAWVSLAAWRMTHYGVAFIPLLATGLLVCTITA